MNLRSRSAAGFSLVEITLALGVAAFCLLAVFGLVPVALKTQQASVQQTTANKIISEVADELRAAIRLPPGLAAQLDDSDPQQGKIKTLHGHWATVGTPDTLYFTNEGNQTGSVSPGTPPSDAVFRATLTYILPPTDTTSLANIKVSWPAQVDPATGAPAGSVETFLAINRK
jgi:type II secretory pathway pseudopilin PulG